MIGSSHDITHLSGATPRRDAVRTIGAAGTALLGLVGLGAARTKSKNRSAGAEHKRKHQKGKCRLIGLSSAESEPFSLQAGTGVTMKAVCPDGFIAISGGLQGASEVTAQCMIRESHDEPDGSAWVINVFCSQATNTPLRVGVICFSRNSFKLQGESDFLDLGQ